MTTDGHSGVRHQYHPSLGPSQNGHHGHHRPAESPPTAEELQEMNNTRVTSHLLNYIHTARFPYINDVSVYEKLQKIGQGTFGEVFKARCRRTGRMVALKKILMENEKEGFPITALREVKMLQQLKHENVTDLIEVCSNTSSTNQRDRSTFYLVFAFCEHDLAGLLSNQKIKLTVTHIKTLLKHLLNGLAKLHRSKILHRDMKTANVLVSKEGYLKLADFGLARPYIMSQPRHLYTNRVVTLWYRPPELLLGARMYGPPIDTWGAGCIMAELWTRTPIMQGDTEQRQLIIISNLCGSICPEVWPSVVELPLWDRMELPKDLPRGINKRLGHIIKDPEGVNMLDKFLSLDPSKRLGAEEALQHAYFFAHPHPTENVKDLMDNVKQSHFEFTVGRGAHANRQPQQAQPQQPPQQRNLAPRPSHNQPAQFHDVIF